MRAPNPKIAFVTVLLATVPLVLACEPVGQEGQPGTQDQAPGQQPPAQQPPAQQPPAQQPTADVSDQELRTFAEVYVSIQDLQTELQTELEEAETVEEEMQVQEDLDVEARQVLDEHGMSIEDYQRMTQLVNTNPEVRTEFDQILEEVDN